MRIRSSGGVIGVTSSPASLPTPGGSHLEEPLGLGLEVLEVVEKKGMVLEGVVKVLVEKVEREEDDKELKGWPVV